MGRKDTSRSEVIDVKPSNVTLKPMLVKFEHGSPNKKEVSKLKCEFLINKENKKEVSITFNDKKDVYKFKGQKVDENSQLCQNFFVIRNKRTNKIRLANFDQLVVSRYLESVAYYDKSVALQPVNEENIKANKKELSKVFGSKRAQHAHTLSSKLNINVDSVKSKMEESTIGIKIDAKDLNKSEITESAIIPKSNPNATDVRNIYRLEDLFTSADVLNSITDVAQSILEHIPVEADNDYSQFLVDALQKMNNTINIDKVKCVLYADALIKFYTIEAKKLNNSKLLFSVCPISKQIRNIILDEFTVQSKSGRTRPLYMRDKIICYALVLLMIAFDYKLDQDFTAEAFTKVPLKRLMERAKAVGFTQVFGQKNWILRFPLPQPQSKSRRKKPKFN